MPISDVPRFSKPVSMLANTADSIQCWHHSSKLQLQGSHSCFCHSHFAKNWCVVAVGSGFCQAHNPGGRSTGVWVFCCSSGSVLRIKSGLWVNPRDPEMAQNPELKDVAKTYAKFWCTWQVDRGDKLPLGAPALMMSLQDVNTGIVKPELVKKRDEKYKISSDNMKNLRANIEMPKEMNPYADYWIKTGKGFAVNIEKTPMELRAPFP